MNAKVTDKATKAPVKKKVAQKKVAKKKVAKKKVAKKKVAGKKVVTKKVAKKKVTQKKVAQRKAAPKKPPVKTASASPAPRVVSDRERYMMIEERAYYLAEARHFQPGHEHDDWLEAEHFVDHKLGRR